jgi:hypothetical protein
MGPDNFDHEKYILKDRLYYREVKSNDFWALEQNPGGISSSVFEF